MNITRTHDYINKTQNKPSEKTSKEHTRGMNLKEAKRANSGTPGILHSFPLISSFLPSSLLRSSFPLFSFFVLSFDLLFDLFHFANGFLATGKILRIILLLFVAKIFFFLKKKNEKRKKSWNKPSCLTLKHNCYLHLLFTYTLIFIILGLIHFQKKPT